MYVLCGVSCMSTPHSADGLNAHYIRIDSHKKMRFNHQHRLGLLLCLPQVTCSSKSIVEPWKISIVLVGILSLFRSFSLFGCPFAIGEFVPESCCTADGIIATSGMGN